MAVPQPVPVFVASVDVHQKYQEEHNEQARAKVLTLAHSFDSQSI